MISWPIIARTREQMVELANPPSGRGLSEAVPWVSYDTELYTSATTTEITWFQTTKATRALSNQETAGAFPAPQFFEPYYTVLDILTPPGDRNALLDVWSILFGTGTGGQSGPHLQLVVSGKEQYRIPMSFLHGSGGPTGFTTRTAVEYANNNVADGGWPMNGSMIVPPTVGFSFTGRWPAAVTLSANRDLRLGWVGTLHRRIL